MSWRETLGAASSAGDRHAHNSQNTQKADIKGNSADCAGSAYGGSEPGGPAERGNSADCAGSAYGGSERERRAPTPHERAAGLLHTNYGAGYRHPDGRVDDGTPEPMPRPAVAWPADLMQLLRRVTTYFEWPDTDRREFISWARRSAEGLADAKTFLETEAAKIPVPGRAERRRETQDRLDADPSAKYAWTLDDRAETDPAVMALAVRNVGACDMGIPREKFDPLGLPMLIDELAKPKEDTQ
jgi:hypothetical protein